MNKVLASRIQQKVEELQETVRKAQEEYGDMYTLHRENFTKFCKIYAALVKLAEESNGQLKFVEVRPQALHAEVSIQLRMLDMDKERKETVLQLIEWMDECSVLPASGSSILVEAWVDYVWQVRDGEGREQAS